MSLVKTTSKLALVALVLVAIAVLTSSLWTAKIARSLVCAESAGRADAMLVENFDPSYVLFERAAALEKAGVARTTFVPVEASADPKIANPVSVGVAELMARQARLRTWQAIIIMAREPISLNAALQIRDRLAAERIRSVAVVTRAFRSRRSVLVYQATFVPAGIAVSCVPVVGTVSPETWTRTWHGIQEVTTEFIKLQYYRFYILPFRAPKTSRS